MTFSAKHAFHSAKTDGGDATKVQPSNWNAEHTITLAADRILGRDSSGAGAVQELTCTTAGRALIDDTDAAAQRTTLGLGTLAVESAVVTADITDANVTTAKLADAGVTTVKIADANVTTAKIADAGVTTAKIADANVTLAKLTGTAQAFQGQLLHVQDQKTAGTDGQALASGSWLQRNLNTTLTNEISGASLASNQISLPAGTYWVEARANSYNCDKHKLRLQNTTDSTTLLQGLNAGPDTTGVGMTDTAELRGRITLAGTKTLQLQHRVENTSIAGHAFNLSVVEVYAEVLIWKVG